jgi:hypothetical protein
VRGPPVPRLPACPRVSLGAEVVPCFTLHFFLFKRPGAGSAAVLRAAPRRWPGSAFAGGFGGQAREGIPAKGQACRLAWCHGLGTSGVTAAGVAVVKSANRARRPAAAGLLCHPPPPRMRRDRSAFARSLRRTGTPVSHTGKAGENSPEPLRERPPSPRLRQDRSAFAKAPVGQARLHHGFGGTGRVGRPGVELHGL